MSNLTVDGDSDYHSTGTPDTYTPASDGPSGTDVIAAQINGVCEAVTRLQILLGNGLTLRGDVADLVTRLSRVIGSDGAFNKGTSFPGTPIDGQPFYRTDLNVLFVYDAGTTSWTVGLDSGTFALADGSRDFTGDVKIKKALPALRLTGQEGSAEDILIRENAGVLYFMRNDGTEAIPSWVEFLNINISSGIVTTTFWKFQGAGSFHGVIQHANTAERAYHFPDFDTILNDSLRGPNALGGGSSSTHDGVATLTTGNLDGIRFYSTVTLSAGQTLTIPSGQRRLIIIAREQITINGTITGAAACGNGAGAAGAGSNGSAGGHGTDQPGGTGGAGGGTVAGAGGSVLVHGIAIAAPGTQLTGARMPFALCPSLMFGGGGGGGGGAGAAAAGGAAGHGGASIILIAPVVILGSGSILNTSGGNGANGGSADAGGGGGGGAGNIVIVTRSYADLGTTFTQTGGTGGGGGGGGGLAGSAGQAGVKQILLCD